MKGLDAHFETQLMQHQRKIDNMKTYKVTASFISYCHTEIEAESEEEAFEIARSMDGGDFDMIVDIDFDELQIMDIEEVTE